jgi:hypothetical protein
MMMERLIRFGKVSYMSWGTGIVVIIGISLMTSGQSMTLVTSVMIVILSL